jgi:thiol-disulfide isomerase/thioredoxin
MWAVVVLLATAASWVPPVQADDVATTLQRLELPADYGQRLADCGVSDADLRGASMATLMGCGLKVGHARRLRSEMQAQTAPPAPPTPQPPAATPADGCAQHSACGSCTSAGCGWCISAGKCVPDHEGHCIGAMDHVGKGGSAGKCPGSGGAGAYETAPARMRDIPFTNVPTLLSEIAKEEVVLVFFSNTEWCSYCKYVHPILEQAASTLHKEGRPGTVAQVNLPVQNGDPILGQLKVALPAVRLYAKGEIVEDLNWKSLTNLLWVPQRLLYFGVC